MRFKENKKANDKKYYKTATLKQIEIQQFVCHSSQDDNPAGQTTNDVL